MLLPELAPLASVALPDAEEETLAGDMDDNDGLDARHALGRRLLPVLLHGLTIPGPPLPLPPPPPTVPSAELGGTVRPRLLGAPPAEGPGNNENAALGRRPAAPEGGVRCPVLPPPRPAAAPTAAAVPAAAFPLSFPFALPLESGDPVPESTPPPVQVFTRISFGEPHVAPSAATAATPGRRRRRAAPSRLALA